MEVLDHEPQWWFLLREGERLFLDAACNHGPVGYSVLIELSDGERAKYASDGHAYINGLAGEIQNSAPHVLGSSSPFTSRDIMRVRGEEIMAAVKSWQARAEL